MLDIDKMIDKAYLDGIAAERQRWVNAFTYGCGDNSCVIHKPTGMATNGGCQCLKALSSDQRREFVKGLGRLRLEAALLYFQFALLMLM